MVPFALFSFILREALSLYFGLSLFVRTIFATTFGLCIGLFFLILSDKEPFLGCEVLTLLRDVRGLRAFRTLRHLELNRLTIAE